MATRGDTVFGSAFGSTSDANGVRLTEQSGDAAAAAVGRALESEELRGSQCR